MTTSSEDQGPYDEDSPQFTREMMKNALRFHELPISLQEKLRQIQHESKKKRQNKGAISIRLSQDVIDELRASGAGWQSRVDEALRAWLKKRTTTSR